MTWNTNIQEAPQDRRVWLATKCERVSVTRWNEKRGAWDGLATGEEPIAWQAYVVPVHPFAAATQGEAAALTGSTSGPTDGGGHVTDGETAQPVSAGEAAASSDILLDDCGSGA